MKYFATHDLDKNQKLLPEKKNMCQSFLHSMLQMNIGKCLLYKLDGDYKLINQNKFD